MCSVSFGALVDTLVSGFSLFWFWLFEILCSFQLAGIFHLEADALGALQFFLTFATLDTFAFGAGSTKMLTL